MFNYFLFIFYIKISLQFLKLNKILKINFLLSVKFKPTTSVFRNKRINH